MNLVFDLNGELSSRREDEHAAPRWFRGGAARFRRSAVARRGALDRRACCEELLQHRYDECHSLARSGFSACNDVVSGKCQWNHGTLNRARVTESEIANALEQPVIQR